MQLPGMATDPVRMSLDVTWWPPSDEFTVSRRLWTRPAGSDTWQIESIQTSGSPIRLCSLPDRWVDVQREAFMDFYNMVLTLAEPFPDL